MLALMYHSVRPGPSGNRFTVEAADFAGQMAWLRKQGLRGVSAENGFGQHSVPRCKTVTLTFDDGYEDVYSSVFPILGQHGFSATVFLPTGHIGAINDWEDGSSSLRPLLSWEQIAEMAATGIEFGSHTVSHLDVRRVGEDAIERELIDSKREIEKRVGTEVVSFAYPYGYFRPEMPALLARAGYRYGLLAGTYGRNAPATDQYQLHRVPVWGGDSLTQFAAKVKGWYWWRYYTIRARQEARWAWRQLRGGSRSGH